MTHSLIFFFSFKSCEPCCFMHHFVNVARKLSRFCKMVRSSWTTLGYTFSLISCNVTTIVTK